MINKVNDLEITEQRVSKKNEHFSKIINWFQKTSQISLSPKLKLKTEKGDSILLSSLTGDKPKLVFKYSELNCHVCVDSQFVFIKQFIKKNGADNLIILSSYISQRSISRFKLLNEIEQEIYNIKTLDTSLSDLNIPYYFILDKSFHPNMIYFPEREFPEDTEEYFKKIEDKYFKTTLKP